MTCLVVVVVVVVVVDAMVVVVVVVVEVVVDVVVVDVELEVDPAEHEAVLHGVRGVEDQHELQGTPQQTVAGVSHVVAPGGS